jgi:hypothetical protein
LYSGCHFLNSFYRPAGGRIPLGMRYNTSSGEVKYLLQQVFFTSNLQVFYFFSTGIVPVTAMKDFTSCCSIGQKVKILVPLVNQYIPLSEGPHEVRVWVKLLSYRQRRS